MIEILGFDMKAVSMYNHWVHLLVKSLQLLIHGAFSMNMVTTARICLGIGLS